MRYATFAVETEIDERIDVDEWLSSLPTSLEDIQQRRFRVLAPLAQDASRIAASLGLVFATRALEIALSERCKGLATPGEVITELIDKGYLVVVQDQSTSRLATFLELMFADEADFVWLRLGLRRFSWVKRIIGNSLSSWYEEVLLYLSHDLDERIPPVPLDRIVAVVLPTLDLYNSGESRTRSLDLFASTIRRRDGDTVAAELPAPEVSPEGDFAIVFAAASQPQLTDKRALLRAWRLAKATFPRSRSAVVLGVRILRGHDADDQLDAAMSLLLLNRSYIPAAVQLVQRCRHSDPALVREILTSVADNAHAIVVLAPLIRNTDPQAARQSLERVVDHPHAAIELSKMIRATDPVRSRELLERVVDNTHAAIELSTLIRADDPVRSREVLEDVADNPHAAIALSRLIRDTDPVRSREVLERVADKPHVAIELSQLIRKTDPARSREVLEQVADSPHAAIDLSQLIRETDPVRSREVLERVVDSPHVAIELSKLIRETDPARSREVLERVVDSPHVAIELSKLIRETDPVRSREVLEHVVDSPHAAIELSQLIRETDPDRSRAILERTLGDSTLAIELSRLLSEKEPRRIGETLERVSSNPHLAIALSSLIRDAEPDKARVLLERVIDNPHAALELSRLIRETDPRRAEEVLERQSARDFSAAIELSRMLRHSEPERSREILERRVDDPHVAIELSRLIRVSEPDRAHQILVRLSDYPQVALELAKLVFETDFVQASELLRRVSDNANVAIELARLIQKTEPERAKEILERWPRDPQAAIDLAKLIYDTQPQRAYEMLQRFSDNGQVAVALAELVRDREPDREREILEHAPDTAKVAVARAVRLSKDGEYDKAYEMLIRWANDEAMSALVLVRNAVGDSKLLVAQSILASHLAKKNSRGFVFESLSRHVWSSQSVLRALPLSSGYLEEFFRYLWKKSQRDSHSAGLYACVARDVLPAFKRRAKELLIKYAGQSAFCAVELCSFPLSQPESQAAIRWLLSHALNGDRRSVFALALAASRTQDESSLHRAIELIEARTEFTDEERDTYEAVALQRRLEFRRLREDRQPWMATTIWTATRLGEDAVAPA
jgi:predicted ThiF/HesA family dinucleotide-utilizing enzyme